MIQATPITTLTLDEFLTQPETKPAREFIEGSITQKPMPKGKHSILQRELTFTIDRTLSQTKIARAFPELRCTFANRSIVPDISIFKSARIPRDPDGSIANDFNLAPDWTIEILSPDQSQTKVVKNIVHCLKHGTQIGWLIDPADRTVFIYHPNREMEIFETPEQPLTMPTFAQQLSLTTGELFDWMSL